MLKRPAAILIPAALAAQVALVVVPLVIDQPFGAQTPRILALAFAMRRCPPVITLAAAALGIVRGVQRWRQARSVAVRDASCVDGITAIVRALDGRSTRVFSRTLDGRVFDLAAKAGAAPFRLLDTTTGSECDFSRAAVSGRNTKKRLVRLPCLAGYWVDWNSCHPSTGVARHTA